MTFPNAGPDQPIGARPFPADTQSVSTEGAFDVITAAFPAHLRADAAAVAAAMPVASIDARHFFSVHINAEPLAIPERIYNAEPAAIQSFSDPQRVIFDCVYTRHHDGFVRHRHLRELLGTHEIWVASFVMRLIGEYVLPMCRTYTRHSSPTPASARR